MSMSLVYHGLALLAILALSLYVGYRLCLLAHRYDKE